MTMALLLKLLLVLLVSSISESQRSCSSEMGKKQGDTLLCKEEQNNLYTEIERRSQKDHTCQTPGTEDVSALRLVLVGLSGVGKSASGNTILGREEFESGIGSSSMTLKSKSGTGDVDGVLVTVVDTPGLFHTEMSEEELRKEMEEAVSLCDPGPHAFLLVIQLGRFTAQDQTALKELQKMYSRGVKDFVVVLFTYGDKLSKSTFTIEEFINKDANLQKLVRRCSGRYVVFNNNGMHNSNQVQGLLETVKAMAQRQERKFFNLTNEREISNGLIFSLFAEAEELVGEILDWVSVVPMELNLLWIIAAMASMQAVGYIKNWIWPPNKENKPTKDESSVYSGEGNSEEHSDKCTQELPMSSSNPKNLTSESDHPPFQTKNEESTAESASTSKTKNSKSESC